MQMAVYAGMPAALNALFAAHEVFTRRDEAAVTRQMRTKQPCSPHDEARVGASRAVRRDDPVLRDAPVQRRARCRAPRRPRPAASDA